MKISDWLDEQQANKVDLAQIVLTNNMSYGEDPDEAVYFKDIILVDYSVQKSTPTSV